MHGVQRLKCRRGAFIFLRRGASLHANKCFCRRRGRLYTRWWFFTCFWSVNEAGCGSYGEPLKSYWHVILSSTAPLRLFSRRFLTLLSDRKSLLLCAACLPAWCPPLGFDTGGWSQALSQGSKDWQPFHFPAWAAQIKGHILNLCVDTPTVKRDGLVGRERATALTSQRGTARGGWRRHGREEEWNK